MNEYVFRCGFIVGFLAETEGAARIKCDAFLDELTNLELFENVNTESSGWTFEDAFVLIEANEVAEVEPVCVCGNPIVIDGVTLHEHFCPLLPKTEAEDGGEPELERLRRLPGENPGLTQPATGGTLLPDTEEWILP